MLRRLPFFVVLVLWAYSTRSRCSLARSGAFGFVVNFRGGRAGGFPLCGIFFFFDVYIELLFCCVLASWCSFPAVGRRGVAAGLPLPRLVLPRVGVSCWVVVPAGMARGGLFWGVRGSGRRAWHWQATGRFV